MHHDYRAEFDIPRDICYLNASYMTPQPRRVVDATIAGATARSRPWQIAPADFFREVEILRAAFARQIGCDADNVAVVPSAGYGVSCAAANLLTGPGDIILAMHDQFPSNYYAWRRQALSSNAEIRIVGKEPGQSWTQALLGAIERAGGDIAVATLEGHHWATGETVDLDVVVPALRSVDARVVLDLTQSIGAYPIDIVRLRPDFMVAAGYKWQFCPYGVAFLYVDDGFVDGVPIEEGWMNRQGAEDFSRLAEFTDLYEAGARRFDVSEKSSFSNIAGAVAALRMLEQWGIATISARLAVTNERITAILEDHGFETTPATIRAPHFQGARVPRIEPQVLASQLIEEGVYASVRGDHLRVAPHLYTDDADLQRLDTVLGKAFR